MPVGNFEPVKTMKQNLQMQIWAKRKPQNSNYLEVLNGNTNIDKKKTPELKLP